MTLFYPVVRIGLITGLTRAEFFSTIGWLVTIYGCFSTKPTKHVMRNLRLGFYAKFSVLG